MKNRFKNKSVLFVTTKNLDYLRNTQEINLIKSNSDKLTIIGSKRKKYLNRLMFVYLKLLITDCKKYDVIFVGFAPQLIVPFFGWKFRRTELIIDFFISMYDTLVFDRKKIKQNSIMAKLLKYIDKKTLKKCSMAISDTNIHGDYFSEEFGIDRNKINTLYLEADTNIYHPMQVERPKEIDGKYVVLYFGSVLPLQGLDIILEAVSKFKDDKDFYFYIIGPINEKYNKPLQNNVKYFTWLSQEELAKKIAEADLCLAGHFNKDINKALRTIPGKAYIYEAMDKPMVLGDNKATHELYDESMKNVFFVEMGNAEALEKQIRECKNSMRS